MIDAKIIMRPIFVFHLEIAYNILHKKVGGFMSEEQKIRNINGSMTIEGMPLTEEDTNRLRSLLRGEVSYDAAVKQIIEKYSSKNTDDGYEGGTRHL